MQVYLVLLRWGANWDNRPSLTTSVRYMECLKSGKSCSCHTADAWKIPKTFKNREIIACFMFFVFIFCCRFLKKMCPSVLDSHQRKPLADFWEERFAYQFPFSFNSIHWLIHHSCIQNIYRALSDVDKRHLYNTCSPWSASINSADLHLDPVSIISWLRPAGFQLSSFLLFHLS